MRHLSSKSPMFLRIARQTHSSKIVFLIQSNKAYLILVTFLQWIRSLLAKETSACPLSFLAAAYPHLIPTKYRTKTKSHPSSLFRYKRNQEVLRLVEMRRQKIVKKIRLMWLRKKKKRMLIIFLILKKSTGLWPTTMPYNIQHTTMIDTHRKE